jgi:serine protease Do
MKTSIKNLCIQFAVCAAAVAQLTSAATADVEIYNKTLKSTAWVLARSGDVTSSGTGVVVDVEKKLLITNFHVVGEARSTVIFFPEFKDDKLNVDRQHYVTNIEEIGVRGRVLSVDRKRDLALIELDRLPEGVEALPLANDSIGPGEDVQSIGNPGTSGALWVFTSGTVRSVYQKQFRTQAGEHDFMVVETQSPINSGDSGGPVVNNKGELVAISQAIATEASLVSYSVDVSELKTFLDSDWRRAPLPIADVLQSANLQFTQRDQGPYEVSFEQEDSQKQSVFVTKDIEYFDQADVRKVWALAAVLKEAPGVETTTSLLLQSARTKFGAWSIERNNAGDYLVIFVCKVDASATPMALKSTMEYVARLTNLAKTDLAPATTRTPANILNSWLTN